MGEQDKTWSSHFCAGLDQQMAMVQLLPCTASGCHPQSEGTVEEEEEEENEMCISHVSVCRTAVCLGFCCFCSLLAFLRPSRTLFLKCPGPAGAGALTAACARLRTWCPWALAGQCQGVSCTAQHRQLQGLMPCRDFLSMYYPDSVVSWRKGPAWQESSFFLSAVRPCLC